MEHIKNGIAYFFGSGDEGEFQLFSLAHFLPILLAGALIFLIWKTREPLRGYKHEMRIRITLSLLCIFSEMSYFWRLAAIPSLNTSPENELPLALCEWAVIFCAYLSVTKSQLLFDISYFWLFGGSIFALIIPVVISTTGPTRFRYYQFWLVHTLGYITICYMMFVHKMRPTWRSLIRALCALVVFGLVAVAANTMLGGDSNYLFLAKPVIALLPESFLPRAAIMFGAVLTLFFLSYLPFFIIDRNHKKSAVRS